MKRFFLPFAIILFIFQLEVFSQTLKIHHINVGQADASLIVSPTGTTMLIDAGNDGDGTGTVLPYLTSLGITSLNYIVNSHYHSDHLGGLDEVITSLGAAKIGKIYDRGSGTLPTTTAFTSYLAAAKATGKRDSVYLGLIIDLGGGVTMKCVATAGKVLNYGTVSGATGSENDLSIGWVLNYGSFQYFTGGDLGGESSSYADSETPLSKVVGDVDVMKVDHHGSKYSTNQVFVDSLRPEVSIIHVGDGNSYSHPVQSTLTRLATAHSYIYQTEKGTGGTIPSGSGVVANNNIIIETAGYTYTVTYGTKVDTYPGDNSSPLPIELINFSGNVNNNIVNLKWNTRTEINNLGFEVQRKASTSNYSDIVFIKGNGTSNNSHDYSWSEKLQPGDYTYRLKQIDNSGQFEYSNEVEEIVNPAGYYLAQNYPNPFNPNTTINYSTANNGYVKITIYNTLGVKIKELINEDKPAGNYSVVFNAEEIASGMYLYRLEAGNFISVKKLILLK